MKPKTQPTTLARKGASMLETIPQANSNAPPPIEVSLFELSVRGPVLEWLCTRLYGRGNAAPR